MSRPPPRPVLCAGVPDVTKPQAQIERFIERFVGEPKVRRLCLGLQCAGLMIAETRVAKHIARRRIDETIICPVD